MVKKIKTAATAINGLSVLDKILIRFFDLFEKKEYFHLNILGKGSREIELFFGLIKFRYGQQIQITIFCSPSAFAIIQKAIIKSTRW